MTDPILRNEAVPPVLFPGGESAPAAAVIIPVLNEAASIGLVLDEIPRGSVRHVLVVDNGSSDGTPDVARAHGATVLHEPRRGYGAACWRGIEALPAETKYVVFLDGDRSDYPDELPKLLQPLVDGEADFVIGSRARGAEAGALMPQQRFGNWLACRLLKRITGETYTDLGPFRAMTRAALSRMAMQDRGFGWTVEMQLKAPRLGLRTRELPVRYRKRIGKSKISGTISGSIRASWTICATLWKYRRFDPRDEHPAPAAQAPGAATP